MYRFQIVLFFVTAFLVHSIAPTKCTEPLLDSAVCSKKCYQDTDCNTEEEVCCISPGRKCCTASGCQLNGHCIPCNGAEHCSDLTEGNYSQCCQLTPTQGCCEPIKWHVNELRAKRSVDPRLSKSAREDVSLLPGLEAEPTEVEKDQYICVQLSPPDSTGGNSTAYINVYFQNKEKHTVVSYCYPNRSRCNWKVVDKNTLPIVLN